MSELTGSSPLQGSSAAGLRFGVVMSRTNDAVTQGLLDGALETLHEHGASEGDVRVVEVAGAFELPMTAARLAARDDIDAIVCIGALVRGETSHFEYLASAVAEGIQLLAIESGTPVTFGVLTCETMEQALARAGGDKGNKGSEAALAAIELACTFRELAGD